MKLLSLVMTLLPSRLAHIYSFHLVKAFWLALMQPENRITRAFRSGLRSGMSQLLRYLFINGMITEHLGRLVSKLFTGLNLVNLPLPLTVPILGALHYFLLTLGLSIVLGLHPSLLGLAALCLLFSTWLYLGSFKFRTKSWRDFERKLATDVRNLFIPSIGHYRFDRVGITNIPDLMVVNGNELLVVDAKQVSSPESLRQSLKDMAYRNYNFFLVDELTFIFIPRRLEWWEEGVDISRDLWFRDLRFVIVDEDSM